MIWNISAGTLSKGWARAMPVIATQAAVVKSAPATWLGLKCAQRTHAVRPVFK